MLIDRYLACEVHGGPLVARMRRYSCDVPELVWTCLGFDGTDYCSLRANPIPEESRIRVTAGRHAGPPSAWFLTTVKTEPSLDNVGLLRKKGRHMQAIKFILWDSETDGIAVEVDGREVWQEEGREFGQYLRHYMPRGVPVLLDSDTRPSEREEKRAQDDRPYPPGESTDSRLQRWLVDTEADPRIRDVDYDENDRPLTRPEEIAMSGDKLYQVLLSVAERFYWHGIEDVVPGYGVR